MGEIKRSKENIFASYYTLHNLYYSLHFTIETFKIEGLILRIYWTSHWRCTGKKVFLEITVYIFENFSKTALKLPCESVKNPWKIPVKKFSFSRFARFQRITRLQKNFFRNIFRRVSPHIPEHLFCRTALTSWFWFNCLCTIY